MSGVVRALSDASNRDRDAGAQPSRQRPHDESGGLFVHLAQPGDLPTEASLEGGEVGLGRDVGPTDRRQILHQGRRILFTNSNFAASYNFSRRCSSTAMLPP